MWIEKQNYFGYWRCWFIGSNLANRLFNDVEDVTVIGIDNMNDYYDVRLKEARLSELSAHPSFIFVKGSIADKDMVNKIFDQYRPQVIVNLALGRCPLFHH